jgi:diguanylate cyclase (GGDEF)-like protein/PAS domain S-box-containing protein
VRAATPDTNNQPPTKAQRAWIAYLVGGVVLGVVYLVVPVGPAKLVVWPLIGWSSVAAVLGGVRLHRPGGRAPWYFLAAGMATFIVGDNLYSIRNLVQHAAVFPSYVDGIYLSMYPLLLAGLALLVRRRTPGGDRQSLIDAAIITGGLGLLSWVLLMAPYVRNEMGLVERFVSVGYPLGDVALLAVAVRLAVGGGRRPTAFWLLAGSIVPLLAADSLYGYLNLAGTWHEHNPVDIGWIIFYFGWGAAALHPSMGQLSHPAPALPRITRRRLVVVGSAALIPPALLFIEEVRGQVVDAAAIAVTAAALFGLVLGRIAGLARQLAHNQGEARFRSLVQNALDAIVVVDARGCIRYQTPSTGRVLGHDPAHLEGRPLGDLLHPSDQQQLQLLLASPAASATLEWRLRHHDGSWHHLDVVAADLRSDHNVGGVVLTMRDSTERKELDEELRRRAFHDGLTGLANRALFLDRVTHALSRGERHTHPVAVLFLDLDDFKMVNDGLGHAAGDELLVAVAERLGDAVRPGDTVARLGGDEFALLLEDAESPEAADLVARRVAESLAAPFRLGADDVPVRASVGIALGYAGKHRAEDLLRDADLAMYMAKRNGKGRFERFLPAMHEDAVRRLEIAAELRGAIDNDELSVFYQPIVDARVNRVIGAEALVRWEHPRRGFLSPAEFIPVAEATGLIVPLGRWVLDEACRQLQEWRRDDLVTGSFYVSVNLSARQLQEPTIVDDVAAALHRSGLPATALLLEVTETALVENLDAARTCLHALKDLGLRLAIDDFGTGYSSLSYVSSFPVDIIKIDKCFVDRITDGIEGAAMVRAVIEMTHSLGLTAVAEGIEQPAQIALLEGLGCHIGQGYLFAKPMPAATMSLSLDRAAAARTANAP